MIPKCIIIADDNHLVRRMVRRFLESQSQFQVCGDAVNGLETMEKALALHPDAILMEFSMPMPMMNGIKAASLLKVLLPDVPVILFTALDSAAVESDAFAAGIRAVMPKGDIARFAEHLENLSG